MTNSNTAMKTLSMTVCVVLVSLTALTASAQFTPTPTPTPRIGLRNTAVGGSAMAQPTTTRPPLLRNTAVDQGSATTQPTPGPATSSRLIIPVKRGYNYSLEITDTKSLGPANVEHEPMEVSYALTISTYGVVGELPELRKLKVCPKEQLPDATTCKEIDHPTVGTRYTGKLRALAPVAGATSPITLVVLMAAATQEDYGDWTEVVEVTRNISVAARYEVSIESFETLHTRSRSTDTAYMNLQALVKSDPPDPSDREDACGVEGMNWCKVAVRYGDVQDGVHPVSNMRVGPYLLTPEREQELRLLYTIYNFGASYDQRVGEAVANGFSKVGMIILSGSATTGSGAASQLDQGMEALHGAMFADCDGLMAVDKISISNRTVPADPDKTLDAFTRDTGVYHNMPTTVYEGGEYQDGNTVCGAGGKYKVAYAIYRTSWRPPTP